MSLGGSLDVNPITYARFCYAAEKLSQQSNDMRKNLEQLQNNTSQESKNIVHNYGGDITVHLREQSVYNRRGSSGSIGDRVMDEEQQIPWEDYTQPHLFK